MFIELCLLAGVILTVLPWISFGGMADWGGNYLLAFVADKTGLPALQTTVSSGWARGAVTALGLLNLFIGFWEIFHFKGSVAALDNAVNSSAGSDRTDK